MRSAAKHHSKLFRSNFTWDPDLLIQTFEAWESNIHLSLSTLSQKVASLLMILFGQRFQTTDCLDIRNMSLSQNEVIFQIEDPLKTSKVKHHLH